MNKNNTYSPIIFSLVLAAGILIGSIFFSGENLNQTPNKFDLLIRLHSSDFRKIDYSKFLKFEVTNTGNIYQHD